MVKRIVKKMDIIEGMDYFWQSTSEKEKVGEKYIINLANFDEMKLIYDEEFDEESVRKVLSAISNREMLSGNKKTMRFWNNNMWMLEDLEYTKMMIQPLKVLNLDDILERLNENAQSDLEEIEVIFTPAHIDEYYVKGNKLVINFFRVKPDLYEEGKVTIGETDLKEFIYEKLLEVVKA
ncbi:TDE2712 family protein [Anaeromicrobium sediminis]|uniref:Uncharacterized protein n=1 Tax=Anaeromicrobium sediminis TaxID=1478221 RepID=A0A267MGP6_9FIRM|nr:hypothetical protein [Anaeromicrobium sediminis]PAB58637.1 hypothetical protein CCE28_14235 [Anaeromicrobium sediminis]